MPREFDVMLAGHVCLDIIPKFPDTGARQIGEIMRPGKLVNVGEATISTGGPVSNTGLNMKTLGSRVAFCARVGDDVLGKMIIDLLQKSGSAEGMHVAEGQASSYTVVVAPPNIDRIFVHNPGTNNAFRSSDVEAALIEQCRHFHLGYPPLMREMYENEGEELERVFRIAKEAGATTSCDMSLPDPDSASGQVNWRRILERILPYVDVFLPSIEETFFMLEPEAFLAKKREHADADLIDFMAPEEYSRISAEVIAMGTKMVSLKSGHRGFYLRTGPKERFESMGAARPGDGGNWADREIWAPAFVVPAFGSATGSGDSAIAGFLSAFLRGLSVEDSLKYATCCGLQNVMVLDAVSGIKPWDETSAMLAQDMLLIDAHVDGEGWRWLEECKLWAGPNDQRTP